MNNTKDVAEQRKRELKDAIVQLLGTDSVLDVGQMMNGLNGVSAWKKKMKEEMVSFNREILEITLNEMVRDKEIFRSENGKFTHFNHYRGLCHTLDTKGRCLCCGEMSRKETDWDRTVREKPLSYCPRCEEFTLIRSMVKAS